MILSEILYFLIVETSIQNLRNQKKRAFFVLKYLLIVPSKEIFPDILLIFQLAEFLSLVYYVYAPKNGCKKFLVQYLTGSVNKSGYTLARAKKCFREIRDKNSPNKKFLFTPKLKKGQKCPSHKRYLGLIFPDQE